MVYPNITRDPHVSPELLERARYFLREKRFCNTRTLKNQFDISGVRAGAVFRKLGWEPYSNTRSSRTYRRKEEQ